MIPEVSMIYKKLAGIFEGACKTSRQLRPGSFILFQINDIAAEIAQLFSNFKKLWASQN